MKNTESRLVESWNVNADAWTQSVRDGVIASRRLATDQAILDTILGLNPARVLDAGCGEGWLARRLALEGISVRGFDGSEPLIRRAEEMGGAHFLVCNYDDFIADPKQTGDAYDVVVFNFALLSEEVAPVLKAAAAVLAPEGRVVIQTLHPGSICTDERYEDGWKEERFDNMGEGYRAPMPWYFRTIGGWMRQIRNAGLNLTELREPLHPETGRPASLVVILAAAG